LIYNRKPQFFDKVIDDADDLTLWKVNIYTSEENGKYAILEKPRAENEILEVKSQIHLGMWLDPFPILQRSTSTSTYNCPSPLVSVSQCFTFRTKFAVNGYIAGF